MKNTIMKCIEGLPPGTKKIILTMKLVLILIFAGMLQISASVYSQKTIMSFTMTDKSVKEVLDYIQEKTEFRFFYNEDFTDLNRKVNLEIRETGIGDILDTLLASSEVTYKVLDNNLIVITPKSLLQQVMITGTVIDASTGEPLVGVTIMLEGTTRGVITDMKGQFSINAMPGETLIISFIGMEAQKIVVDQKTKLNIALKPSVKESDEVVVIGYGTLRKADVTSAVSNVKQEDFLSGNIQDAAELVKGKVAGLTVTKGSGDPNATSTIRLRGITSMLADISPLVLVDGIEGSLNTVAPENIVSIDVLKDASAAAIYGTRGANGVILITTNSGKRQAVTQVNYSGYATMSDFYKVADFMDPTDVIFGKTALKDRGWDTDWLKAVSRTGFTQNHNLSINGGTEKTSYSANVSYRQEEGTIKKSNNDEMKMQFDLSHWLLNDKIKLNFNLIKGMHKNALTDAASGGVSNIYRQAVIRNPTEPIYNVDNDPSLRKYYEDWSIFQYYNPVAMINENLGEYKSEWTRLTGNILIEPFKGWQRNPKLSTNRSNSNTENYTTRNYYTWKTAGFEGYASKGSSYAESNQLELTTRYDNVLGSNHRISALAGYSYQYDYYESLSASNYDFPTDAYLYHNLNMGLALKNKVKPDGGLGSYAVESKL